MAPKNRSQQLKIPGTVYTVVIDKDERKFSKAKFRLIIKLRGRSDGEVPLDNLVAPQIALNVMELLRERNVKFVESAIFALSEQLIKDIEGDVDEVVTYGVVTGQKTKITEKISISSSEKQDKLGITQDYMKSLDDKLGSMEIHLQNLSTTLNDFIVKANIMHEESAVQVGRSSFENLVDVAKKKRLQ